MAMPTATPSVNPSATSSARTGDFVAESKAAIDSQSGAGIRGFQNTIAFPGATQTNSNDINQPPALTLHKALLWGGIALAAVVILYLIKKHGFPARN